MIIVTCRLQSLFTWKDCLSFCTDLVKKQMLDISFCVKCPFFVIQHIENNLNTLCFISSFKSLRKTIAKKDGITGFYF